jgi:hypothetical protein
VQGKPAAKDREIAVNAVGKNDAFVLFDHVQKSYDGEDPGRQRI